MNCRYSYGPKNWKWIADPFSGADGPRLWGSVKNSRGASRLGLYGHVVYWPTADHVWALWPSYNMLPFLPPLKVLWHTRVQYFAIELEAVCVPCGRSLILPNFAEPRLGIALILQKRGIAFGYVSTTDLLCKWSKCRKLIFESYWVEEQFWIHEVLDARKLL